MSGLDYLADELRQLEQRGLRRRLRQIDGVQTTTITVNGREAINFSSNNYLGLAADPILRDAARASLDAGGFGAGASRLIAGNLRAHRAFEQFVAQFHGAEAALLFNSGYQANVGALSALAGPEDAIFSDALNHASLIDGARLARAQIQVYSHANPGDLATRLATTRVRRRFIVTDSVFSMDGDVAPLRELRALADRSDSVLLVDEAHATGVLGPGGRGLCAELGVVADVHVGTLSKGLGGFGAYVAGSRNLVDFLTNRARSFVFTTAMPPSLAAAAEAALRFVDSPAGEERRGRLSAHVEWFAGSLRELGLLVPGSGSSPIFPILVGDDRRTMEISETLLARGIYAQGIRPPTVPAGTARLRFALMATHELAHLAAAVDALAQLVREGLLTGNSK